MKDAYAQAVFTLQWNQKTEQNTEVLCQYKDVVMYHLFSRMESEMEPVSMQSEFYRELAVYDREHHTSYGRTVLCYLKMTAVQRAQQQSLEFIEIPCEI